MSPALNAFLTPEEKYELPQPIVNLTQHRKSLKKEGQGDSDPALWGTSPAIIQNHESSVPVEFAPLPGRGC